MPDCNKTEVFVREYRRMCKSYSECWKCPIQLRFGSRSPCSMRTLDEIDIFLSIVQKWSDEHPIKTRQSEFLKMFPKPIMDNKTIQIDPCVVEQGNKPPQGCSKISCSKCTENYWSAEVE